MEVQAGDRRIAWYEADDGKKFLGAFISIGHGCELLAAAATNEYGYSPLGEIGREHVEKFMQKQVGDTNINYDGIFDEMEEY